MPSPKHTVGIYISPSKKIKTLTQRELTKILSPSCRKASPRKSPSRRKASPRKSPSRRKALPRKSPSRRKASPRKSPSRRRVSPRKSPSRRRVSPRKSPSHRRCSPIRRRKSPSAYSRHLSSHGVDSTQHPFFMLQDVATHMKHPPLQTEFDKYVKNVEDDAVSVVGSEHNESDLNPPGKLWRDYASKHNLAYPPPTTSVPAWKQQLDAMSVKSTPV